MTTTTQAQLDLTTKDLAQALGCTPRMVNIYRESIEQRTGRNVGYKIGRTTYFRPEEQHALRAEREHGQVNAQEVGAKAQQRSNANYSETVASAEGSMQDGMSAIVQQSDAQAIQMGQMLGQRFNGLMMGAMMQTMAQGMTEMQNGMAELTASLQCSVPTAPQIGGGNSTAPFVLEAAAHAEPNGNGNGFGDWQ